METAQYRQSRTKSTHPKNVMKISKMSLSVDFSILLSVEFSAIIVVFSSERKPNGMALSEVKKTFMQDLIKKYYEPISQILLKY